MLFTRCPGCQTTFRITADTLRVANGAVRCGSCATVFSAFSGLQQDTLQDDLQTDDEFLSPTMQTRELAGIEEIASPEVDEVPTTEPEHEPEASVTDSPSQQADDELADIDAQLDTEDGDPQIPIVDTRAETEQDPAKDAEAFDSPLAFEEDAVSEAPTPEQQPQRADSAEASESSDKLHFDLPTDDWALLMNEIEKSTEAQAGAGDDASDGDPNPREEEAGPDAVDLWDVGDPAATESWTEIEMSTGENTGNEHVAVGELESPLDMNAPVGEAPTDAEASALLGAEPDISAAQVDATLSADPDPDLAEALEAGLQMQSAGDQRLHLWAVGCAALAFALVFQVVHHFRTPLAGQILVGSLVQGAYGLFGAELVPEWDLDQYEILNWVATEAGLGNLRITAQIRNNGPRTQPYPHIHLELKDRWEAVVGSRVFEPVEYLQPDADFSDPMIAGVTVPADFAVVDPGEDAYGFELDVCIQLGVSQLSCASQRVFE